MKIGNVVLSLLYLFVITPIWMYLLHVLLVAAHADSLAWFLYWIYLPVSMFSIVLSGIVQGLADHK